MKNKVIIWSVIFLFALNGQLFATTPDYYYGDSSVYTGTAAGAKPNIMFLIDNSGAMKDMGSVEPYDASVDYGSGMADPYPREQVYLRNVANENNTNYQTQGFVVDEVDCSSMMTDVVGPYAADAYAGYGVDTYQVDFPDGDGFDDDTGQSHPRFALEQNGFWYGALNSQGECPNNQNQFENYFTGNFRNYLESIPDPTVWAAGGTYSAGDIVTESDAPGWPGLYMKCLQAGTSGAKADWLRITGVSPIALVANSDWPDEPGQLVYDNGVVWEAMGTVMDMVQYQLKTNVLPYIRTDVNIGLMTFGDNNHGGKIVEPVANVAEKKTDENGDLIDDTEGQSNYIDLVAGLQVLEDLVNGNTQPVNESLWDAYLYWIGESDSSDGIASDSAAYDSPIEHWCQSNHTVILTTGSAGNNSQTKTKVKDAVDGDDGNLTGDDNSDGVVDSSDYEGLIDDVAALLYTYLDYEVDGKQAKVSTNVIQLMTPEVERLRTAAETYGHGLYYNINNPAELLDALMRIIAGILEEESSFVAPVVPASPENRAYSGQRIYLGFFKPMNDEPWYGNLKKFGLNFYSQITAFNSSGDEVLATDTDGYFLEDDDGNPTIHSYWGTTLDGGRVDAGGVGALLLDSIGSRTIYTYTGDDIPSDVSVALSEFKVNDDGSPSVTAATLGVDNDTDAVKLINFIHGKDAYADFSADTSANRYWVMGDVMHSKPVVLKYAYSDVDASSAVDEDDPSENKSYIFVGANDGMLHAFRDANGTEAWGFIPEDLLPNLKYLHDTDFHYYFVDNSPTIYVYDADNDDTITVDDGDKAILICSMRRGGGNSTITGGAQGSYFALDISDPEDPQYMWSINSANADFSEMGQTWSLPRLARMKIGSADKVVMVIGAGYDTSEDMRYGNTQTFTEIDGTTITSDADRGAEDSTSSGTIASDSTDRYLPSGRGLYVVEIATLGESGPVFTNSGSLIWGYTQSDNSNMSFAIPSDPLVVDRDNNGYIDHIYIGDTGGQLWRFNVASTDTSDWAGTLVFTANTGSAVGRKVFFKPTATVRGDDTFIYFGTGDREHPLNTAVTDRFYVVRDRQVPTSVASGDVAAYKTAHHVWDYSSAALTESKLVDLTENQLQDSSVAASTKETLRDKLTYPDFTDDIETDDNSDTYYGWYMKLVDIETNDDGDDEQVNYGEKALSIPKVFNNVLYFTTYTPITPSDTDDPCSGELGPSLLYAVTADTAEAVYNFYTGNDTVDAETGETTEVLGRRDRSLNVGDGIASEPLIMVNSKGAVSVMVGRGGGFFNTGAVGTIDPVFPLYWMKW